MSPTVPPPEVSANLPAGGVTSWEGGAPRCQPAEEGYARGRATRGAALFLADSPALHLHAQVRVAAAE